MADTSLIFPEHAPPPRPKRYAPAQRYRPEPLNEEYRHVHAPAGYVDDGQAIPSPNNLAVLRREFDSVMALPDGKARVILILRRYNLDRLSEVKKAQFDDVHASLVLALM